MAIIYKITNLLNNKIYIGETIRNLNIRWNEHKHESITPGHGYSYHLHNAMRKYGIDNFIIEIIDNCPDEKRFIIESQYIKIYDSANPKKGYNTVVEGDGCTLISTDAILEAWNEGLTITDTAKILGVHRTTVSNRLSANGITEEEIKKRFGESVRRRCSRPVLQYDLDGNFIKRWPSATSCKEKGYEQGEISACCHQKIKIAYGYLWKYEDDERPIQEWINNANNYRPAGKPKKPIQQFDLNMNLISEYDSAADAARALNKKDKSNICAAARKSGKAYGYYWKYKIDK